MGCPSVMSSARESADSTCDRLTVFGRMSSTGECGA
jgi:hypothetical protein